jgi:Cd2+/Zn2+-exporting ATPase
MSTERWTFCVDELDCADEVLQLRKALESCPGVLQLDFDIFQGRMHVQCDSQRLTQREVIERIARVGMHGRVWSSADFSSTKMTFWQRYGRAAMTVAAGLMLLVALLLQTTLSQESVANDLISLGPADTPVPWLAQLAYAVSIFLGVWFVAPRAWSSLIHLRADMNLLMCVAVCGAIGLGQWLEAAVVTFLFAVSLLLEHWSLGRARAAISSLIEATPQQARCVTDEGDVCVKPIEQVQPGEQFLVRPGEKLPLDGLVRQGSSTVDQAPITGESVAVNKCVGDAVFAGTVNQDGALQVEATSLASDTTFARIIHLVEEAQASRAPTEQWVERFARYYTPAMMTAALVIAIGPPLLLGSPWSEWIYNALVLLVIACPCALVISTPVTIVSALTSAARAGVLIKGGRFLEAAAGLQAVAIDKTGTLTYGRPVVGDVIPFEGHTRQELLQRAASMEMHSMHPIANAILDQARAEHIAVDEVEDYRVLPGQGAEANMGGQPFWIGNHRLWSSRAADSGAAAEVAGRLQESDSSVVAVGNAEHVCGLIGIKDAVREEASAVMARLKQLGIQHLEILSGDNQMASDRVAAETGVDAARGELMPEDKVAAVTRMRQEYSQVAMVGDGVNDAPALAAASLSIAMGAIGTDAAIETADVALMVDDLTRIPWLIYHGRRAMRVIKQNIAFALGLKLLFVVLAIAGMASLWMAILADTGASLLVIFNGMRLLKAETSAAGDLSHR